MKITHGILLLPIFVSGCVNNLPQGYLGGDVERAEIIQKSYTSFEVVIFRLDSRFSEDKVRSVLRRAGVEFSERNREFRFLCSRAELVGLLAIISENGTVTTRLGSYEIECGRLGFPVESRGDLVIVAAK